MRWLCPRAPAQGATPPRASALTPDTPDRACVSHGLDRGNGVPPRHAGARGRHEVGRGCPHGV